MPTRRQRLLDLLAMGRVANVPTVLCNVFTGCLLGAWFWGGLNQDLYPGHKISLLLPLLSGACLYLGGCFLNDWSDSHWDKQHRPERAIPSGRIHPQTVLKIAAALLAAGLALAFYARVWALLPAAAIATAILIYTRFHKQTPLAIIPMGLCRGLLYVLGFFAQALPQPEVIAGLFEKASPLVPVWQDYSRSSLFLLSLSLGLLAYIAGLSLAARFESKGQLIGNTKLLALLLLATPILTHTWIWIEATPKPSYLAAALFALVLLPVITLIRKRGLGLFVSALLAIIPLIDLIVLAPISRAAVAGPLVVPTISSTTILAVPFLALLLALALQRLAPAT
ncbi:MAG: UbiA family prenyltransferase [Verrucomicrobia bacterium]|nr:UbiA family prenyltransferase [Verrucomicrobiota bacterium]